MREGQNVRKRGVGEGENEGKRNEGGRKCKEERE